MKTLSTLLIILTLKIATVSGQCTNQVYNLSGDTTINGIHVTVTSTGIVDSNSDYCAATLPYFIGWNYALNISGNGSYSFNFSPSISGITLNFGGVSDLAGWHLEEVKLFVNGAHYQIPFVGSFDGCEPLAVLSPLGDIHGCSGCAGSGWKGTTINGPISSLTVKDTVILGNPCGAIFSIFICDSITTEVNEIEIPTSYTIFPNPFFAEATLRTNKIFKNASLIFYNSIGQKVKQIDNITGQEVTLYRDKLPSGLFFLYLTQDNKKITIGKLAITE